MWTIENILIFALSVVAGWLLVSPIKTAARAIWRPIETAGADDEPELDPITQALVVAAELATVEGNAPMAAAARSLNQLYLLGFEHLAAGALAREVVCAKVALEVAEEPLPFNLCRQGHRHESAELVQACNIQAAEDRELRRCLSASLPGGLASEGNIG